MGRVVSEFDWPRRLQPAGHARPWRLRQSERRPVQPGGRSPRSIPTNRVGRQRTRYLALMGQRHSSFRDRLPEDAKTLRRGLGRFAEFPLQLRHWIALPTVLPRTTPERWQRPVPMDHRRLLSQLPHEEFRDDTASGHDRWLYLRRRACATDSQRQFTVGVRADRVRLQRPLDRHSWCPLHIRRQDLQLRLHLRIVPADIALLAGYVPK